MYQMLPVLWVPSDGGIRRRCLPQVQGPEGGRAGAGPPRARQADTRHHAASTAITAVGTAVGGAIHLRD